MHACVSVCMSACMYACEFIGVYVRMHLCGSCCEGHLLSRSPIGSLGKVFDKSVQKATRVAVRFAASFVLFWCKCF